MKCLSIRQPFAELIISGRKSIELRPWNTNFRGQFLVHASGNVDYESCTFFKTDPNTLARRAVVGKAILYGVKEYANQKEFLEDLEKHLATAKYATSRYGFLIKDPVRFKKPIYVPGRLGFFDVALDAEKVL